MKKLASKRKQIKETKARKTIKLKNKRDEKNNVPLLWLSLANYKALLLLQKSFSPN